MKRKDLYEFYYIQREIEMWEAELEAIGYAKTTRMSKAPGRSNVPSNPTPGEAAKYAEISKTIGELRIRAVNTRARIYKHIAEIKDSQMRQIVMHRCISLEKWEDIAVAIGGGNTADSVRMKFNRTYSI